MKNNAKFDLEKIIVVCFPMEEDEIYQEQHYVRIDRCKTTNKVFRESWLSPQDMLLHRFGAPALREFDLVTGQIVREEWREEGLLHRNDGPSIIKWHPETGRIIYEAYCLNGHFHRDNDKPAKIWFNSFDGKKIKEIYFYAGQKHRTHGPAFIKYDCRTGIVLREKWKQNNITTREGDEPAIVKRDPATGTVILAEYVLNNVFHREGNKPAIIRQDPETKIITQEEFWVNGEGYRSDSNIVGIVRDSQNGQVIREYFSENGQIIKKEYKPKI